LILTQRQRIAFLLPFILVVVPFTVWPALFGLVSSFTNYAPFQTMPLRFVGFNNYLQVLGSSDFRIAIRNAIVFTTVTVSVELIVGMIVAYLLRKPFFGRGLVRFILLIPWLVSPVANGVMWHFLVNPYGGLINFWPALFGLPRLTDPFSSSLALPMVMITEIWRKAPLAAFLLLPGLLAIPAVQWDLADLEGMSLVARIRHIVLPRLRLLLLTIALLLIGDALGTAESILVLTGGGPGSATMTPGLYSYEQAFHAFNWTGGSTSAWLIGAAVLLVGVCYLILARREALQ
jgi:multiple sugar transport system permease protein